MMNNSLRKPTTARAEPVLLAVYGSEVGITAKNPKISHAASLPADKNQYTQGAQAEQSKAAVELDATPY